MKVLLTGAFGYLGGRISQEFVLQKEIHLVLASTQHREVPSWAKSAEFKVIEWDNIESLENACFGVDVIIHTAGMSAPDSSKSPKEALQVNGLNTCALIQSAIRQGVKRFIYLSTAHVYASPLDGYIDENTCPKNLHPYATSHKAGEEILRYYSGRGEIEGVVLRISNSFGRPAYSDSNCWDLFVNDLCVQAFQSRKMTIRTDFNQRRDFVPISRVISVIRYFLEEDSTSLGDGIFNVGNGMSLSLKEMAEFISTRFELLRNEKIDIEYVTNSNKVYELCYSCEKLNQLGLKPMDLTWMEKEMESLMEYIGKTNQKIICN